MIFSMKCVFYITEHNAKGGPHQTEFLRFWNAKSKYDNGESLKKSWEKGVICLVIIFPSKVLKCSKLIDLYFLLMAAKLVTIWACVYERSYWVVSKNGMVNNLWSDCLWNIDGTNIKGTAK